MEARISTPPPEEEEDEEEDLLVLPFLKVRRAGWEQLLWLGGSWESAFSEVAEHGMVRALPMRIDEPFPTTSLS